MLIRELVFEITKLFLKTDFIKLVTLFLTKQIRGLFLYFCFLKNSKMIKLYLKAKSL
jgi:hypothetical protein